MRRKEPVPAPIKIAGIYTICHQLGLPKSYGRNLEGKEMVVAMASGKDAIFRYTDAERAGACDWVWHNFEFDRYVREGEKVDAPRYC